MDSADGSRGDSSGNSASLPLLERYPAPPRDVLSILRTFLDTQQRRVGLWAEYEDAMEGHFRALGQSTGQAAGNSGETRHQLNGGIGSSDDTPSRPPRPADTSDHRNHSLPRESSSHYDSTPLPLSDSDLLSRIISLVTSGLLDCAHETRTIAVELSNPAAAAAASTQPEGAPSPSGVNGHRPSTEAEEASNSSTFEPRPDLSRIIDNIQDLENAVLRKIVRRDQLRRGWIAYSVNQAVSLSSSSSEPPREEEERSEVAELNAEIDQLRKGQIAELMTELRGEMADLQLGG